MEYADGRVEYHELGRGDIIATGYLDGDAWPDLIFGAPDANPYGPVIGGMGVISGPVHGLFDLDTPHSSSWGVASDGDYGISLAVADLDGDGRDDVAVSAPGVLVYPPADPFYGGAIYVLPGDFPPETSPEDAFARILDDTFHGVGERVAAGDFDCDGQADIAAVSPYADLNGSSSGGLYVHHGPFAGEILLSEVDATIVGDGVLDYLGSSLATAGDVDGDGCDELLVGESGYGDSGAVYLLRGGTFVDGVVGELAWVRFTGSSSTRPVGGAVGRAGDVDGDGREDVLLGSSSYQQFPGNYTGAAFLFLSSSL
ncbi:integrin alpha [Myxococcota bacterium]|nr:integrin alpha [Myxococcota bacterium]